MDQAELNVLIDKHELWVTTDGAQGKRLQITKEDMAGLDLAGRGLDKCEMTHCDLTKADLSNASLIEAKLDHSTLDRADLQEAFLTGAQFRQAHMVKANLVKVDANGATFEKAVMKEVQAHHSLFRNADMSQADMRESNFADAALMSATLVKAKLGGATFTDANLDSADLSEANAWDENYQTNFEKADLDGANLTGANLTDCTFENASLIGTNFDGANLESVDFDGANATRADFSDTMGHLTTWPDVMDGAELTGSVLHPMHEQNSPNYEAVSYAIGGSKIDTFAYAGDDYVLITDANDYDDTAVIVTDADFWVMAHNLVDVPEEESSMSFWEDAYSSGVNDPFVRYEAAGEYAAPNNMTGVAILATDVTLEHVEEAIDAMEWEDLDPDQDDIDSLKVEWLEYNDPQGVQILGNYKAVKEVEEQLADYVSPVMPELEEKVAHGKQRKAVVQLRKVTQPMKVAAFKKMFPAAFESVKGQIKQTIQPEQALNLIKQFGMTWLVSMTEWESTLQRLSPDPNEVMQLNVDLDALTTDEDLLKTLLAMRRVSRESVHPVVFAGDLMTVGWVRFSAFTPTWKTHRKPKVLLIEEIQSDLPTIRKAASDESEFRRKLEEEGGKERVDAALDLMAPFVNRFYHDALAATFDLAAERGIDRVEMLTHETKKQFGSPMNVYEKLPKSMSMKKISTDIRSQEFIEDDLPKVWAIQVISDNPRRRSRKQPTTWTRHQGYR